MKHDQKNTKDVSRRTFLAGSSVAALAATGTSRISRAAATESSAYGKNKVRVAMIGCGDRGTYDAVTLLRSVPGVELYAMADLFQDKIDSSLSRLRKDAPGSVRVRPSRVFLGFDAYKKVLEMDDIDLVMLLTPPGFRPQHVTDAVDAGKHIFMEKPGAVDPVGIRSLIDSAEKADKKGVSIVVGTQQRYAPQYIELIKRVQDGQIGELKTVKAHWICGMVNWHFHERQKQWSDMEWQVRCWPFFTWLSGDHLVEQLCHNIDVCNWVMETTPESCMGLGGRQVRTGPEYGNIYDHFSVEYKYPNGLSMYAIAAQMSGVSDNVSNTIEGTKGIAQVTRGWGEIKGEKPWKYEGRPPSGMSEMFNMLIKSIREKKPVNECRRLAEATMTAIMGRVSTYTGRVMSYDRVLKQSKLDLVPKNPKLGSFPVRPVAMPGKTKFI